jgi:hypothetical protein
MQQILMRNLKLYRRNLYLLIEINWNYRIEFIIFLEKTGLLYGSNEERKESNKEIVMRYHYMFIFVLIIIID